MKVIMKNRGFLLSILLALATLTSQTQAISWPSNLRCATDSEMIIPSVELGAIAGFVMLLALYNNHLYQNRSDSSEKTIIRPAINFGLTVTAVSFMLFYLCKEAEKSRY